MAALVTIETILLVLLAFLMVGLMRSHAEILKWMASPERANGSRDSLPVIPPSRASDSPAHDLEGTRLDNTPVVVPLGRPQGGDALLAFLSSGCTTCGRIWNEMHAGISDDIPASLSLIVVTKDRNFESPSKLAGLVPGDAALVMSSQAWEDYKVPRYPYFIYVNGAEATIVGEGTAESWDQVMSLIRDFVTDAGLDSGAPTRAEREDSALAAAGITHDHPSLYAPIHGAAEETTGQPAEK